MGLLMGPTTTTGRLSPLAELPMVREFHSLDVLELIRRLPANFQRNRLGRDGETPCTYHYSSSLSLGTRPRRSKERVRM